MEVHLRGGADSAGILCKYRIYLWAFGLEG